MKTASTRSRAICSGYRSFVRTHGTGPDEQVIIIHHGTGGQVEVARHDRVRPGSPALNDDHFPGTRAKIAGDYEVRARSADEPAFFAIGDGARTWLIEAAAARTERMNVKWPTPSRWPKLLASPLHRGTRWPGPGHARLPGQSSTSYEKRSVPISSNLHPGRLRRAHAQKPWPRPLLTGSCATPTLARPTAIPSASPRPLAGKGVTQLN
ncbi:hypothetical protein ACFC25_01865 [Pseudarthrobacter sp. NPDC055928]|uniref:hypothetical protein n=1 Tax=Pseudarthrobacter sp. NPDC055928 TaxID=3345661 RepID=UPI0035E30953